MSWLSTLTTYTYPEGSTEARKMVVEDGSCQNELVEHTYVHLHYDLYISRRIDRGQEDGHQEEGQ